MSYLYAVEMKWHNLSNVATAHIWKLIKKRYHKNSLLSWVSINVLSELLGAFCKKLKLLFGLVCINKAD